MNEREKKTLGKLQRLCSRAEYCSGDILRKALKEMEGEQEAADRILQELIAEHYVDDLRYSVAFAREKATIQGWGPVKIRFQLRAKGVDDETIRTALTAIDAPRATQRMERLLREKARLLSGDPQIRLKLIQYALGRGYSYDVVDPLVKTILSETA